MALEDRYREELQLRKAGPGLHLPKVERLHVVGE
jgi:hypothetical protein